MKKMILTLISILVVAALLFAAMEYSILKTPTIRIATGATPTPTQTQTLNSISQWLDALEREGKFNGTILFSEGGTTVFQRSIGNTDAGGRRSIGDRTSFNLASVSKHLTAYGILLLAHEGKLSRSDLLVDYLPELARYSGVTLDHLLNHTSGIPDYATANTKKTLADLGSDQFFTPDVLITRLQGNFGAVRFSPGEKDEYSNSNYVLLAEIIARVSRLSYAKFMDENIFQPLGMVDTAVVNQVDNTHRLFERAYGIQKKYLYVGSNISQDLTQMDGGAGDGNIYSTAADLVKWDAALRAGRLLPSDYYAQTYVPLRLNDGQIAEQNIWGTTYQFGLGWTVQDMPVVTAYGSYRGFSNFYRRDLEHDSVLIILSNSGPFLRTASIFKQLAKAIDSFWRGKLPGRAVTSSGQQM